MNETARYERKISARRVASAAAIDRRLAARKAGECDSGGDEDDQDGEDESSDLIDRPLAERSRCAAGRGVVGRGGSSLTHGGRSRCAAGRS